MKNKRETVCGLRLYKPNYLEEKKDVEICYKILSLQDDGKGFDIITGKFMPKQEHFKPSKQTGIRMIEEKLQSQLLQRMGEASDRNLRKQHYPDSYLIQISSLLSSSTHCKNYYLQRKAMSPNHSTGKAITTPMLLSPQSRPNLYTRNFINLPKAFSHKNIMIKNNMKLFKKIDPKENSKKNKANVNLKKIISCDDDEYSRFDSQINKRKDKILKRLKSENNFYHKKDKVMSKFEIDKEKLFGLKHPPKKSNYLKNEYSKTRTPFIRIHQRYNYRNKESNLIKNNKTSTLSPIYDDNTNNNNDLVLKNTS